jgi:hypothetical protein
MSTYGCRPEETKDENTPPPMLDLPFNRLYFGYEYIPPVDPLAEFSKMVIVHAIIYIDRRRSMTSSKARLRHCALPRRSSHIKHCFNDYFMTEIEKVK